MKLLLPIYLGQEAICPHGLGRISEIQQKTPSSLSIRVQTYINDRSCLWSADNVQVVPLYPVSTATYNYIAT